MKVLTNHPQYSYELEIKEGNMLEPSWEVEPAERTQGLHLTYEFYVSGTQWEMLKKY